MQSGSRQLGAQKNTTVRIIFSLLLGVFTGLMFGEECARLKWIGDAFVGLLQMTVLPYILFSLIVNVGRLTESQGKSLVAIGLKVLLVLWAIGIVTVLLNSLAFPNWPSGSFYSHQFEVPEPESEWLKMFIPANPFNSLANNLVPAVVIFSIGVGIALMRSDSKSDLLDQMEVIVDSLSRLNKMVIRMSPVGIFAIMANASGTLEFHQFGLLQAYVLVLSLSAFGLSLFLLPMLISVCTPFRFREIVKESTDTMITAFVIGSSFVVLPMIIDSTRQLLKRHQLESKDGVSPPEFIIPLAFPFPDVGRILMLTFIPFAVWFYGTEMSWSDYPEFLGVGLLGAFGSMNVTIPLLLEEMQLPSDIFQLYLGVGVYTSRLGDVTKAMHLLTFTTIVTCVSSGVFFLKWRKILVVGIAYVLMMLLGAFAIQQMMEVTFKEYYDKEKLIAAKQLLNEPVESTVLDKSEPNPVKREPGEALLDRVLRRGVLRVGYDEDEIPFSFYNKNGELVGYDIDMAHRLARDLGVTLEFVPLDHEKLMQQLADDHYDIAMSGLEGTVHRASVTRFSDSYMDVTLAVMVPDYAKDDSLEYLKEEKGRSLRLAVVQDGFFAETAHTYFPEAEIVEIGSEREFFDAPTETWDGLVTSAETGFAWTIIHPEFTVVNPLKIPVRIPLYYLGTENIGREGFLNVWLELRQKDGTRQKLYEYWILGDAGEETSPRWCIARDILGWLK